MAKILSFDEDAEPEEDTPDEVDASDGQDDSAPAFETKKKETVDRTDDPVRMYLREMGAVELLSREGEIAIGGEVVNDLPPKDRDIAMVFQNYALYPHMTVAENMSFGLKLRKFPKAEIKARMMKPPMTPPQGNRGKLNRFHPVPGGAPRAQ